SAAGMIAAYVKLTPQVGPSFDLVTIGPIVPRVLPLDHTVLVVPMDTTLAPRAFTWSPGVGPNVFLVDAGTAVTGTVVDRGGAPLAGAQIQLVQAGVPSTIATTAANGTFTARASFGAAAMTTITVTPPATSGLAKLAATAAFDLAQPINVSFAASPATCDLAGTRVLRGGVNQTGAIVSVVGSVGAAGTIAGVSATGMFHASATATAGTLPSLLVPRAALGAVAQIAANDYAVVALDTSACVAQTIDAPARIAKAGTIDSPGGLPVGGVRIEAVPTGTLALANLIPVEAVTASDGTWAMQVASGATYDVKVIDPAGRGTKQLAPSAFPPATMRLDKAQVLNGTITLVDGGNVVEGAAVQLLCASCSGLAAQTPIAATATDITGFYQLAIPDPRSL
ncbi:MAG TPA: carboxypeptidase-like regulatory domain-containing protein, partial [Kofleriaceae bacterium]